MRVRLFALLPAFALASCVGLPGRELPVTAVNLVRSDGARAGVVRIFQDPGGVLLRIEAAGLPPGLHGVHVHAVGRCDAPDFATAAAHWNPTLRQHGHQNPAGYHLGDLGNLGVGSDGRLVAGLLIPGVTLWPSDARPALDDADGATLVIHAAADDQRTDPSGNSGARIACAVLG